MISYTTAGGFAIYDIRGLSTDEKPLDVPNGSSFYEMDKVGGKNRVFMFDAENGVWLEQ